MNAARSALIGSLAWLGASAWAVPHLLHPAWAYSLLWLAALVCVPLLIEIVRDDQGPSGSGTKASATPRPTTQTLLDWARRLQGGAAILLVVACVIPAGTIAILLALPWVGVLACLALMGFLDLFHLRGRLSIPALGRLAGLSYGAIGAAWLLADRSGFQPLGFSPEIVLLTAVHFHFAGLLLPVLAGKAARRFPGTRSAALVVVTVVLGVPAVAVGITTSQLKVGPGFEVVAACLMAAGGLGVAWLQAKLALQRRWSMAARFWWAFSAAALVVGMGLAALYGLRSVMQPWRWLGLPWMRALHGTANALGFGLGGTLAWFLARDRAAISCTTSSAAVTA